MAAPPHRVRVDSPEIDSINRTTQRISNWLHNDFREVIKPLQVLPSLPGILEDLQNRLVEQFRMNFSGQVAVEMKAREANIILAEQKSGFLEGQTDRKRSQLADYSQRIKSRYNRMSNEIAQEHESFLNQIDRHAYRITDDIYPNQIQAKFSFLPDTQLELLTRHAAEAALARTACLTDEIESTVETLQHFTTDRQAAYAAIDALDSGLEDGSYAIPFQYAIFEEHETGDRIVEMVIGRGEFDDSSGAELVVRFKQVVDESPDCRVDVSLPNHLVAQLCDFLINEHHVPSEQIDRFKSDYAGVK